MIRRTTAPARLRVGVIGTGAFARACHLPAIASHPRAEVTMLCGRDAARTRALALEFGIPSNTIEAGDLCASADVDAVTICTPNSLHAAQALAAIANGKHVFCEKPLALTVEEAQAMTEAACRSGVVHQVGFTYRHLFGIEEMARRVRSGDIGEPRVLSLHHQYVDASPETGGLRWQHSLRSAGGGVLRESGSHHFDLALFLLGPVAEMRTVLQPSVRPGVEGDDIALSQFHYESGALGRCFASRIAAAREPNHVEVRGRGGTLRACLSRGGSDGLSRTSGLPGDASSVALPAEAGAGGFHALYRMMHAFVDSCLQGELVPGAASFRDGLAVQRMIAAAEESAARDDWVSLPRAAALALAG